MGTGAAEAFFVEDDQSATVEAEGLDVAEASEGATDALMGRADLLLGDLVGDALAQPKPSVEIRHKKTLPQDRHNAGCGDIAIFRQIPPRKRRGLVLPSPLPSGSGGGQ